MPLRNLNLKLIQFDAHNKAKSQDLYPQMIGHMYYVNPPKSLLWLCSTLSLKSSTLCWLWLISHLK